MGVSIDRLKQNPLFTGLSDTEIEKVLSLGHEVTWEEGETLCSEGEIGGVIFIIYSGSVKVSKRLALTKSSQESEVSNKVLRNMDAAEPMVLGESALLANQERTATVTTTRKCEGLEITGLELNKLCAAEPLFGYRLTYNLACILSERLRVANRDVARLATALTVALG